MKQKAEKQTWEAPAATAAIRVRALSMASLRVENLGGRCKKRRWKGTGIKTDLNRPKKETGWGSSSPTGLETFTSMVVGSPFEVMEEESCFSDCFGSVRGLFGEGDGEGEGEGFSFSSDDMLGNEGGRSERTHPPSAKYFYPGAYEGRPCLGRLGRLHNENLSIYTYRSDAGRCKPPGTTP
jgi:hypothetical protein